MSLSQQDRDWVKAMIQEATAGALNAGRDFTRSMVEGHVKSCPNVLKVKLLVLGVGIGLGVSAPQWVKGVIALFGA